ncbi:MAG: hypothetical protein R6U50_12470 [Desulfobacterales bacterium]
MYLIIAVINNEEVLDELITGWLDIGVTGSTVIETTDSLQLISHHVPIFAGFRSFTSGGMKHNKTLFTVIENESLCRQACDYLESLCRETECSHQGIYAVVPIIQFNRLGLDVKPQERHRHMEKKIGRPLKTKTDTCDEEE